MTQCRYNQKSKIVALYLTDLDLIRHFKKTTLNLCMINLYKKLHVTNHLQEISHRQMKWTVYWPWMINNQLQDTADYLADQGEARGCFTNTIGVKGVSHGSFVKMPFWRCHAQKIEDCASSNKVDSIFCCWRFLVSRSSKLQYCLNVFIYGICSEYADFDNLLSCIGKVLR